jgi:hypothetical protein
MVGFHPHSSIAANYPATYRRMHIGLQRCAFISYQSVLLNARSLNQNLFTIVRQNSHQNELAFEKANADMIMQPTLVTARKILLLLIAPLLKHFFRYLLAQELFIVAFKACLALAVPQKSN